VTTGNHGFLMYEKWGFLFWVSGRGWTGLGRGELPAEMDGTELYGDRGGEKRGLFFPRKFQT